MDFDCVCKTQLSPGEGVLVEALRLWCAGVRMNDYGPWAAAGAIARSEIGEQRLLH